ncbi:MAG: NAD(P)/FAD-dependent oxidoreductase [Proteobacteria bacterium]|nr:NAD(P)/FAD-dependent oxidoreductase [Pseudomonadota bacterium]
MKLTDKQLGMDRAISRRDFINGVAAVSAASAVPLGALAADKPASAADYPPLRTGLRGNHPGSFEVAHELIWQGRTEWGPVIDADADLYDLIVVGAGISGLAAAHFYRQKHPDARMLLLDNHDDFGGHAKRNEFSLDGKTIIGYGGSQSMEEPSNYSRVVKRLLRDIGIDIQRFEQAYDQEFFHRFGLRGATFFDQATFGQDQLVNYCLLDPTVFLPAAATEISARQAVAQMPLSENARKDLLRLLETRGDHLHGVPVGEQWDYLYSISYREFLERHIGISNAEIFALFQGLTLDTGASIEESSAGTTIGYLGLPGLLATGLADSGNEPEPYIHHFPDGNASIARLLVRQMIPGVAPGSTMDDIVLADFDYARLDEKGSPVRLRLNSTVVNVTHDGALQEASQVTAVYVRGGQAYRVRGKFCVMAGNNAMVPKICPDMPTVQKEELALATRSPIIYTSVLLRNWHAVQKLGVGYMVSPGAYYGMAMVDFPVSMGGYVFAKSPEQPIILHMERFPKGNDRNASLREQILAGRRELYATPFASIERETRTQLAGALAAGGFDPAEDIAAITVNRWAHGYAYERSMERGRQRHGRISIANSDAGGVAYVSTAIEQAHRAVRDLSGL